MKQYNKPVIQISGLSVEDVIAVSILFSGETNSDELQSVYKKYLSDNGQAVNGGDKVIVLPW